MKKGKFGISLAFYGILAFVLALLKQPLLCGLLLGFVILAEDDRWTVRQVLQGFVLSLVVSCCLDIGSVVGTVVSMPFQFLFRWTHYDFAGLASFVRFVFVFVIYMGALVFSVLAIMRLRKDQEANVPLLSNLSYRVYGEEKPRPTKQPVYPPQGYQPPMPYPPQQGQAGAPQPPMQGYPMPPQGGTVTPPAAPDLQGQTAQLPYPLVPPEPSQPVPPPQP